MNQDKPRTPPYADYLYDIYRKQLADKKAPIMTTNLHALEDKAREAMTQDEQRADAFGYVAGGAGNGSTMAANRRAFERWALVPRVMQGGEQRDLRMSLFGDVYPTPLIMAPVGVQTAFHADGEQGVAAACAALAVPYCYSTAASTTLEEVAATKDLTPWFQLYWPRNEELTQSLLDRAYAAGCRVLVVTVDTFTIAWRPTDLDAGFLPFLSGHGSALGFSDPVFRALLAAKGLDAATHPRQAALCWLEQVFPRRPRPWADLARLCKRWPGAVLVKGVLHPEDARLARQHGADGVIVSNHGGRQVDGAVAALDMLPRVVAAVQGHSDEPFPVLFDSGVRAGPDIIKALCLGARAVLVGRPVIYGLGIAGRPGAEHVLASLLADLDQTMSLVGATSLADLGPHLLQRVE